MEPLELLGMCLIGIIPFNTMINKFYNENALFLCTKYY